MKLIVLILIKRMIKITGIKKYFFLNPKIKEDLKSSEKILLSFLRPFFVLLVKPYFFMKRIFIDQVFLVSLNSSKINPSPLGYIFWFLSKIFKSIIDLWNLIYINEGIKVYSKLIKEHYSEKGRGYLNLRGLNDLEKENKYKKQEFGRIEFFVKKNLRSLDYKNGDSFLDIGCGFGQNIIVLEKYFPSSKIRGFDINKDVISIVNKGLAENPNIEAFFGSIKDLAFLKTIKSNSFDNIVISHVFAFVTGDNYEKTIELRNLIINELIRISKKTVFIIDSDNILQLNNSSLKIEQRKRGMFAESIIKYFRKHTSTGEIMALFSDECVGVLFRKF